MNRMKGKQCAVLAVFICFLFCSVSCTHDARKVDTSAHYRFMQSLSAIDLLIENGNHKKALSRLSSLKKKASGSISWLSIVKRQRALYAWDDAVDTLRSALRAMPASEVLAAMMVDTLILSDRSSEALQYTAILSKGEFSSVAAYAHILAADVQNPLSTDPYWWIRAADATGNNEFYRNAAVVYAGLGQTDRAIDSFREYDANVPGERLFRARLYHDVGLFERVFPLYEGYPGELYAPEDFSVVSDSLVSSGKTDSDTLWKDWIRFYPESSPVPWYNLAVSTTQPGEFRQTLEQALQLYPADYPLVALYVRSAHIGPDNLFPDSISRTLRNFLFYSLDMKERELNRLPYPDEGRKVLDNAVALTEQQPTQADLHMLAEHILYVLRSGSGERHATGLLWEYLERYPDSQVLHDFAQWFFLSTGQNDTAFEIHADRRFPESPFVSGLGYALRGDSELAIDAFDRCAGDVQNEWRALANKARVLALSGKKSESIETWSLAASRATTDREKSALHYEAAAILAESRMHAQAIRILEYALDLDPSNQRARSALSRLEYSK